jgi:hypothetical protein
MAVGAVCHDDAELAEVQIAAGARVNTATRDGATPRPCSGSVVPLCQGLP